MANQVSPQQGNLDITIKPDSAFPIMQSLSVGGVLPRTFRVLRGAVTGLVVNGVQPVIDTRTGAQIALDPTDKIILGCVQSSGVTGASTFQLGLSATTNGALQVAITAAGNLATLNGIGILGTGAPYVNANQFLTLTTTVTLTANPSGISVFILVAQ